MVTSTGLVPSKEVDRANISQYQRYNQQFSNRGNRQNNYSYNAGQNRYSNSQPGTVWNQEVLLFV